MQGKIKSSVIQFRSSQHLDARKGPHSQTGAQAPKSGGFNFASITYATSAVLNNLSPPNLGTYLSRNWRLLPSRVLRACPTPTLLHMDGKKWVDVG